VPTTPCSIAWASNEHARDAAFDVLARVAAVGVGALAIVGTLLIETGFNVTVLVHGLRLRGQRQLPAAAPWR
jgi:hypothetical protein